MNYLYGNKENLEKKICINDKDIKNELYSMNDINNIKEKDNNSPKVENNCVDSTKEKNNINKEKQINKISYEKLVEIVFSMNQELNETKANLAETNVKLTNTKTELTNTNKELANTKTELTNTNKELANTKTELNIKIDKLLVIQKLMCYQISMLQSRDISKSIYHYFAEHLGVKYKNEEKPFNDLINSINSLNNNDNKIYSNEQKLKLRKFLKTLFFINKVHNRILHNNLSSAEIEIINKMKYEDDELLPLISIFGYDQLFETLGFYIENNAKINQIQEAMKYIYNYDYINDSGLYSVKDEIGEAIIQENNNIKIILTKQEINDVKNIFSEIKDFETFCNIKTWDKSIV